MHKNDFSAIKWNRVVCEVPMKKKFWVGGGGGISKIRILKFILNIIYSQVHFDWEWKYLQGYYGSSRSV